MERVVQVAVLKSSKSGDDGITMVGMLKLHLVERRQRRRCPPGSPNTICITGPDFALPCLCHRQ
jgi:hypothetical protein